MIRLFIKFFVLFVSILLFSKWSFETLLAWRMQADRERVVTGVHLGGLRLVAQQLRTASEDRRESILGKIQLQFRAPLELRSLSELDEKQRRQLNEPNGYFYELRDSITEHLAIGYDKEKYLRLGPFNDYTVVAFEDALWGWLQLLAYKVDASDKSSEALEQISSEFGLPVQIQLPEFMPQSAMDRFRSGRDVAFYSDSGRYFSATKLSASDEYLRLGPLPEFRDVAKPTAQTTLTSSFLLSAVLIGLLAYSLSRKFQNIESVARSIARGNLAARADESKAGEVKELAIALNSMAAKTEKMIQSKRELLQTVSHELRTPLARLRFAVDLLESRTDDPKRDRRVDIVNQSINELEIVVGEILDYVKNEHDSALRSQEWVDVRRAVEPICKLIEEENSNLTVELPPDSAGQTPLVYADQISFLRVVKNIAGNANRYAKSKLVIRVYIVGSEQSGKIIGNTAIGSTNGRHSQTCVEFEDDGSGIPEDMWIDVIEPFVRVGGMNSSGILAPEANPDSRISGVKNYAGIGLGLTIVNRILKQHGGTIQISRGQLGGCLVRTFWPNPVSPPPMV